MKKNIAGARERILKKSMELFYAQGIYNTGINQIIDESSVAKTTFYHHFSSKDDLIVESIMRYSELILRRIERIAGAAGSISDFFIQLAAMIKKDTRASDIFNGCPVAGAAFGVSMSSDKFKGAFTTIMNEWQLRICAILKVMKEHGELALETDIPLLSRRIMQVYEGAFTMWRLTHETLYFDDLPYMLSLLVTGKKPGK